MKPFLHRLRKQTLQLIRTGRWLRMRLKAMLPYLPRLTMMLRHGLRPAPNPRVSRIQMLKVKVNLTQKDRQTLTLTLTLTVRTTL